MNIVQLKLNELPGLSALPDEVTVPGYANPNEYVPNRDPNYIFRAEDVRVVIGHLTSDSSHGLLLWGDKGAGKSSVIRQLCAYLNRPLFYVSGHSSLETEDLYATKEIVDGDTISLDGPLLQAWKMPHAIFLFEEVDRARSAVTVSLNPLLDGYDLVNTIDAGVRVPRAEGVRMMFTSNTNGMGDMTGDYNSAVVMDTSLLDRVWAHQVDYPEKDQEFDILRQSVDPKVGDEELRRSIDFAKDIRYLHSGQDSEVSDVIRALDVGGAIHTTVSTRTLLELWHVMCKFPSVPSPMLYALRLVVTGKCTRECAEAIERIAESHFASS